MAGDQIRHPPAYAVQLALPADGCDCEKRLGHGDDPLPRSLRMFVQLLGALILIRTAPAAERILIVSPATLPLSSRLSLLVWRMCQPPQGTL
jgi:hypothetical protein